jgi:hypothetical protein
LDCCLSDCGNYSARSKLQINLFKVGYEDNTVELAFSPEAGYRVDRPFDWQDGFDRSRASRGHLVPGDRNPDAFPCINDDVLAIVD